MFGVAICSALSEGSYLSASPPQSAHKSNTSPTAKKVAYPYRRTSGHEFCQLGKWGKWGVQTLDENGPALSVA
ncbi:hypothetical protein V2G26_000685 [Clonostachys chloroleuca]